MAEWGALGYGIGAVLLVGVIIQQFVSWRGQLDLFFLLLTVLVTLAWTSSAAWLWPQHAFELGFLSRLETLRLVALLVLGAHLLATNTGGYRRLPQRAAAPFRLAIAGLVVLAIADLSLEAHTIAPGTKLSLEAQLSAAGFLLMSSAAMMLAIRAALAQSREALRKSWALWAALGLAIVPSFAAYVAVLITDEGRPAMDFAALAVPPMAFFLFIAVRWPGWSRAVHLSHGAAFTSALAVASLGYVALVFAGVVALDTWGGNWNALAQFALVLVATLALAAVLWSEPHRAQLRVFLHKHFFNYKYDYRDQWLRFIRTLSRGGPGAHLLETVVQALAQIVGTRGGSLWLRADHGPYDLAATLDAPRPSVTREPVDSSLVKFLRTWQWVINVDEYVHDPDLYQDLTLPDWLRERNDVWLVVPLMQDVELLGFVVLDRPASVHSINWEDHDLLKTAGRQAATHLAQLMAVQALVEAREFQTFSRLSAFVIHDLKNLVAQLQLVVSNAAKHKHNPAFMEDATSTVQNCVAKMNRLLSQLRKGKVQAGKNVPVNIAATLREVVHERGDREPRPTLELNDNSLTVVADHDRLGAVFTHLIQNAQEATPPDGWVKVKGWRHGEQIKIEISDNGCGMDANFIRDRLFRPFDSTKGQGGMGIGAFESREYVRELNGDVDVTSQPGRGSTFVITLPATELPATKQ